LTSNFMEKELPVIQYPEPDSSDFDFLSEYPDLFFFILFLFVLLLFVSLTAYLY